ncbi:MAG: hypothetical protein JO247_00590 [Chloroflexi bacterium]|nr:hypothetical protein [Chloroflexota bacterium]
MAHVLRHSGASDDMTLRHLAAAALGPGWHAPLRVLSGLTTAIVLGVAVASGAGAHPTQSVAGVNLQGARQLAAQNAAVSPETPPASAVPAEPSVGAEPSAGWASSDGSDSASASPAASPSGAPPTAPSASPSDNQPVPPDQDQAAAPAYQPPIGRVVPPAPRSAPPAPQPAPPQPQPAAPVRTAAPAPPPPPPHSVTCLGTCPGETSTQSSSTHQTTTSSTTATTISREHKH